MNLLVATIVGFFIFLIGLLPFRILYVLSDIMHFFLYHVVGYRREVVKENFRRSFPDLSPQELKKFVHLSYKNLTDLIIEGIKGFTLSKGQVFRRYKILNPEILDPFQAQGKSVILVSGHFGNWEWGGLSAPLYFHYKNFITFYKPLSNQYIDRYIHKNRTRTGSVLIPIAATASTFKKQVKSPALFVLVADQSPSNARKSIWIPFLGQDTAFLRGPEKYAKEYDLPVVFVNTQRIKRGFYELTLSILIEKPSNLPPGEATAIYAKKLEEVIYKKPEDWLWSHKRWKLNKP